MPFQTFQCTTHCQTAQHSLHPSQLLYKPLQNCGRYSIIPDHNSAVSFTNTAALHHWSHCNLHCCHTEPHTAALIAVPHCSFTAQTAACYCICLHSTAITALQQTLQPYTYNCTASTSKLPQPAALPTQPLAAAQHYASLHSTALFHKLPQQTNHCTAALTTIPALHQSNCTATTTTH